MTDDRGMPPQTASRSMRQEFDPADQGVSLSDIAVGLWSGRGIIAAVTVLAILVGGIFVAASWLDARPSATYLVTLKNIMNESYPNGTAFSPQDLTSNEVLADMAASTSASPEALRAAIVVAYESPVAAGISRNYRDQLAAARSAAEITTLNEQYLAELRAASQSSLRISVDCEMLGASQNACLGIARSLPERWAEVFTSRHNIFRDPRVVELALSRGDEDLANSASMIAAIERVDAIREGLQIVGADNRLSFLRTSAGLTAADLAFDLQRFEVVLFAPARMHAFKAGDAVAASYIADLRFTLGDLGRRVEAYDAMLRQLRVLQQGADLSPQVQSPVTGDEGSVQLGDTALSTLVDLANRTAFAPFVERALTERNDLALQISRLTRDLEAATAASTLEGTTGTGLREEAAAALKAITQDYLELLRLAQQAIQDRAGDLYAPMLGPIVQTDFNLSRSAFFVGVLALGGFALAGTIVLLRRAFRRPLPFPG